MCIHTYNIVKNGFQDHKIQISLVVGSKIKLLKYLYILNTLENNTVLVNKDNEPNLVSHKV